MESKEFQDQDPAPTDLEDGCDRKSAESPRLEKEENPSEFTSVFPSIPQASFTHIT